LERQEERETHSLQESRFKISNHCFIRFSTSGEAEEVKILDLQNTRCQSYKTFFSLPPKQARVFVFSCLDYYPWARPGAYPKGEYIKSALAGSGRLWQALALLTIIRPRWKGLLL